MNNVFHKSGVRLLGGCAFVLAAASLLSACGEPKFKIKGEIYGAEDKSLVLEKSDFHGRWIPIDSTRTSKSGAFSISRPAPAAPEIFRLALDGRFIYLPVDSTETVTVTSSLKNYGTEFSLAGTPKAEALGAFEKELIALPADITADSLDAFKRKVFTKYMRDAQGSVVSYYILTKTIGDRPLFDPQGDNDYKYFAAVATGFKELRPDDPRTRLLEATSMEAIRKRHEQKGIRRQIQATEISVIDIDLPDENNTNRKLSDMVGKGKPVIVMFTLLTHPDSPAVNAELAKIYNAGSADIYQVSLDPDQYSWRDAAKNLPWTTVFDASGQYSQAAVSYNVGDIPTFFIYDRQGELKARAADVAQLRRELSSL